MILETLKAPETLRAREIALALMEQVRWSLSRASGWRTTGSASPSSIA
jgi:hypothetical protein